MACRSVLSCFRGILKSRGTGPDISFLAEEELQLDPSEFELGPLDQALEATGSEQDQLRSVFKALETSGCVGAVALPEIRSSSARWENGPPMKPMKMTRTYGGGGGGGRSGDDPSDEDDSDDPDSEGELLELKECIHSCTRSYTIQNRMGSRKVINKFVKIDVGFLAARSTNWTPSARVCVCDLVKMNRTTGKHQHQS